MNILNKLFKKRSPKPLTEFSKWFIRMVVFVWMIGGIYLAGLVTAEMVLTAYQVITTTLYSDSSYMSYSPVQITVHAPELATYICVPLVGSGPAYLFSHGFLNAKKVEKAFDPNYDDKFNKPAEPEEPNDAP